MTPEELLIAIKRMLDANQTLMHGPMPSRDVAEALGLEVVLIGSSWTIANEKRPEYMQLSPSAYLASDRRSMGRRSQQVVSRNVYLRYQFRRARTRSLEEIEPSHKSVLEWYPWLDQAT